MVDSHRHVLRNPIFAADRNVRDVVDRLVDHSALGLRRRDAIRKIVEADDGARLRNLRGLAIEEREVAGEAAGPIERRACRENYEAGMRDQHAAPRPIVFVGEAPLGASKDSLPDAPAARSKEGGEPASYDSGIVRSLEACVERNGFDLDRAQRGEPRRNDSLERADRQRREDQTDNADVPGRVVDVVEIEAQDRARDRSGIRLKIDAGILPLVDNDAEQREHSPNDKERDGEEYAAEGSDKIGIEPSRRSRHDFLQRRSSGTMTQIESS